MEQKEMSLLAFKVISLTRNSMYSTMATYQKHFQSLRGVPQGLVFSTILFLLHLDGIDNCLHHSSIIKQADDTVIYVSGNHSESIQEKLNANIFEVHNWLTDNDLSLNLKMGKTEIMIFGTSIRVKKAAPLNIQIKGTSINQT